MSSESPSDKHRLIQEIMVLSSRLEAENLLSKRDPEFVYDKKKWEHFLDCFFGLPPQPHCLSTFKVNYVIHLHQEVCLSPNKTIFMYGRSRTGKTSLLRVKSSIIKSIFTILIQQYTLYLLHSKIQNISMTNNHLLILSSGLDSMHGSC